MSRIKFARMLMVICCVGFLAVIGGCTSDLFSSADMDSEEPNDDFENAQKVSLDELGSVEIAGSFSSSNDCDVFSLGEFAEGDTIAVEIRRSVSLFDNELSLGLFDGDYDVANMADVTPSTGYDSAFEHTVRKAGQYYLAIYQSETQSLDYEVKATLGNGTVPDAESQTVYLYFNAVSSLEISGMSFNNLKSFSSISMVGNASAVADDIIELIRNDYSTLDITFVSSYTDAAPSGSYSTVYVTGSTGEYYGLADDIDWYNANHEDNAVIFAGLAAEDYTTSSEFKQMVANLISHELGHLLGLIHTDDNTELMDAVTPTNQLTNDQDFHRATITASEFPVGWEDTMELLTFTLGIE
jgi:predicted Zn-dependent protease